MRPEEQRGGDPGLAVESGVDGSDEDTAIPAGPIPRPFEVGDVVLVAPRTWPGMNKHGGVALVQAVRDPPGSRYDVKYIVSQTHDRGVEARFITPHRFLHDAMGSRARRSARSDDPAAPPSARAKRARGRCSSVTERDLPSVPRPSPAGAAVKEERPSPRGDIAQAPVAGGGASAPRDSLPRVDPPSTPSHESKENLTPGASSAASASSGRGVRSEPGRGECADVGVSSSTAGGPETAEQEVAAPEPEDVASAAVPRRRLMVGEEQRLLEAGVVEREIGHRSGQNGSAGASDGLPPPFCIVKDGDGRSGRRRCETPDPDATASAAKTAGRQTGDGDRDRPHAAAAQHLPLAEEESGGNRSPPAVEIETPPCRSRGECSGTGGGDVAMASATCDPAVDAVSVDRSWYPQAQAAPLDGDAATTGAQTQRLVQPAQHPSPQQEQKEAVAPTPPPGSPPGDHPVGTEPPLPPRNTAFKVGDLVTVRPQSSPGVNREGGVARVTRVDPNGTYDVKYLVRKGTDRSLWPALLSRYDVDEDGSGGAPARGGPARAGAGAPTSASPTVWASGGTGGRPARRLQRSTKGACPPDIAAGQTNAAFLSILLGDTQHPEELEVDSDAGESLGRTVDSPGRKRAREEATEASPGTPSDQTVESSRTFARESKSHRIARQASPRSARRVTGSGAGRETISAGAERAVCLDQEDEPGASSKKSSGRDAGERTRGKANQPTVGSPTEAHLRFANLQRGVDERPPPPDESFSDVSRERGQASSRGLAPRHPRRGGGTMRKKAAAAVPGGHAIPCKRRGRSHAVVLTTSSLSPEAAALANELAKR